MIDEESIDCMITRFTKITNTLSSLGDDISNNQNVRKVIRALPTVGPRGYTLQLFCVLMMTNQICAIEY